jgi:hypothetical protein
MKKRKSVDMDDDDEHYESDYAYSSGDEDGMDDDDEGSALKSVPSSSAAEISLLGTADLVPLMDMSIRSRETTFKKLGLLMGLRVLVIPWLIILSIS